MKGALSLDDIRAEAKETWARTLQADQIFVGMSTCGLSAGAAKTRERIEAELLSRGIDAGIIDVGCLGLCYEEPLVYVKPSGQAALCYGGVTADKVPSLVKTWPGQGDGRGLGPMGYLPELGPPPPGGDIPSIWDIPMLSPQVRIALRNCGLIDPENAGHYLARGGYSSLAGALGRAPEDVIEEVKLSGLRGRGGAGFPTGVKWEFCRRAEGGEKYLICNADEGDPGAFMDRSILEGDPHAVVEGMAIAAYAIGAAQGYVYCRAEYPLALKRMGIALDQARSLGLLGEDVLGSGFSFDVSIKEGAGAFVCGEETALMASIEGRRGMPRTRPPFPANSGLWDKPTNINNVETLANLPPILEGGGAWYSSFGMGRSRGTKTLSLAGSVRRTGLIEVPMGTTLREIVFDIGGGMRGDLTCKGVLTGGPSGGCIPSSLLDTPVDYESLAQAGSIVGSGSMIVIDQATCIVDLARFFLSFTQRESCGKCVPCRIGTRQMMDILERITKGEAEMSDLARLERLAKVVRDGSLCGLGATAPNPVLTALRHFLYEFEEHILMKSCPSLRCSALISFAIDPEICRGCGSCVELCPVGAISGERKKVHVIDKSICQRCGACLAACSDRYGAIRREKGVNTSS